ncbi:hypothetical protein AVEN_79559-1 [Araneus ventricosus]|uniref:Uncharacterized protein n=1 Tax=Araneus ventricosus TaxID=182803 RepID=A0A4Y2TFH5_ARAVE|nr:hypothetical protein AVEN_79559-1 [Araneus ventricosus]
MKIKAARNSGELNNATIELQTLIINSCNKSFKIKKQLLITKPNWWTEQLEIHKKKVRALRRRAQLGSEIKRQVGYQVFKKEKSKYKRHIKQARNMDWGKLCSAASHPYGKQYKAAFRKSVFPSQIRYLINGDPNGNLQEAAQNILHQIFLSPAIPTNYNLTTSTQTPDPPFPPRNIGERRKRPAAGLLLSSYFTFTDNREGAGETYDSEADLSSGVHQQPERPTVGLQRRQICGYSHQRATKQT